MAQKISSKESENFHSNSQSFPLQQYLNKEFLEIFMSITFSDIFSWQIDHSTYFRVIFDSPNYFEASVKSSQLK